jgi:hypothetical protein
VIYQSIKDHWSSLPEARFLPPTRGRAKAQTAIHEMVAAKRADSEARGGRSR